MIELKHICKTFDSGGGEVEALKDVSLTIEKGEIYGIIGMSGAGKSTLVRCMNLLERPTSGEIWVNGQELEKMTPKELRRARGRGGGRRGPHRRTVYRQGPGRRAGRPLGDAVGAR